jgi:hypothetical protein
MLLLPVPAVQASIAANTYVISGPSQTKSAPPAFPLPFHWQPPFHWRPPIRSALSKMILCIVSRPCALREDVVASPMRRCRRAEHGVVLLPCSGGGDAAGDSSAAGSRGHPGAQQEGGGEQTSGVTLFHVVPSWACPPAGTYIAIACALASNAPMRAAGMLRAGASSARLAVLPDSTARLAPRRKRMVRHHLRRA